MIVYINQAGWACELPPCYLRRALDSVGVDIGDEFLNDAIMQMLPGQNLRYINSKWFIDVYDERAYQSFLNKQEITALKQEIIKAKEDVEQVELFGMPRDDYEQKKARCVEIIERLRVLEK